MESPPEYPENTGSPNVPSNINIITEIVASKGERTYAVRYTASTPSEIGTGLINTGMEIGANIHNTAVISAIIAIFCTEKVLDIKISYKNKI